MSKKLLMNNLIAPPSPWPEPINPLRTCTLEVTKKNDEVLDYDYFIFKLQSGAVYPAAQLSYITITPGYKSRFHFRLIENTIPLEGRTFSMNINYFYNENSKTEDGVLINTAVNNAIKNNDHNEIVTTWLPYDQIGNGGGGPALPAQRGPAKFSVDRCVEHYIIVQMYFEESL